MKKHELLKFAYDNYPEGIKVQWFSGIILTLSGKYKFVNKGDRIHDEEGLCVYDAMDEMKWAEIITTTEQPDLLDGKCAIQVNNEREFKLLMEHYEGKGWVSLDDDSPRDIVFPFKYGEKLISYSDYFVIPSFGTVVANDNKSTKFDPDTYKIIPFSDFAKHVGIEVPVYVLRSEDGVDLYEGDKLFEVNRRGATKDWYLVNADNGKGFWIVGKQAPKWKLGEESGYVSKAFSTREAAEKWIEEQNKPKCIVVSDTDEYHVEVYKDKIRIKCSDSVNHKDNIMIYNKELTEIWNAYQSLQ